MSGVLMVVATLITTRSARRHQPDALRPVEDPAGYTLPAVASVREDLVQLWEGPSCRDVFSGAVSLESSRPKFDATSGLLVPDKAHKVWTASGGKLNKVGARHVTWEDTLDARKISIRPADGRLLDVPRAGCRGRPLHCEHAGVPLAVGSLIRPLRGIFHSHNRSLFAVPIEKSACSSLKSLFGYRLLHGCPHPTARTPAV